MEMKLERTDGKEYGTWQFSVEACPGLIPKSVIKNCTTIIGLFVLFVIGCLLFS